MTNKYIVGQAEEPVEYSGLDKSKKTRATIIAVIFCLIVAAVITVVAVIASKYHIFCCTDRHSLESHLNLHL